MSDHEYNRLRKMKDPMAEIDRPAQEMTIYRTDGSSVTITSENGVVQVRDSRKKNMREIIMKSKKSQIATEISAAICDFFKD